MDFVRVFGGNYSSDLCCCSSEFGLKKTLLGRTELFIFYFYASIWECFNHQIFVRSICSNKLTGVQSSAEYKEMIEKIERMSRIFCYALIITLGFLMPPALLFTAVNYLIYDLQEESFYLLYPILYVLV